MSTPLMHANAVALCPHAGQVTSLVVNQRVRVSGQTVLTLQDTSAVLVCALSTSGSTHFCTQVKWSNPATRIKASGAPIILHDSQAECRAADQTILGNAIIVSTQLRARGI